MKSPDSDVKASVENQVVKFWSVFSSEEVSDFNIMQLYSVTRLPKIVMDPDTGKQMDDFLNLVMQFKRTVGDAT